MTIIENILKDYRHRKGTYITLKVSRVAKTKKSFEGKIEKISVYKNARLGIAYDNLSQTEMNRNTGELPQHNQGLPWGEWKEFPFVVQHKGNDYLRMYVNKKNISSVWLLNGTEVSKNIISEYLLASEKSKRTNLGETVTLTVKESSIIG